MIFALRKVCPVMACDLFKNHRLSTIQQHPVFCMVFQRTRQHQAFDIMPDGRQIVGRMV